MQVGSQGEIGGERCFRVSVHGRRGCVVAGDSRGRGGLDETFGAAHWRTRREVMHVAGTGVPTALRFPPNDHDTNGLPRLGNGLAPSATCATFTEAQKPRKENVSAR